MERKPCYNCDSACCVFFSDYENNTEYYLCRHCGKVWREIAGIIPISEQVMDEVTFLELLPLSVFEAYTDAVMKESMQDCVHKCLYCSSPAYETELGLYNCSNENCGFTWEVYQHE